MRQLGDEVRHELAGVWARSGLMLESTITLLPLLLTQSNSVLNPEFKQPFELHCPILIQALWGSHMLV